ncbi:gluconokinase [Aurantimonas sp. A3-2-R12]|uniref:gluconokinase n=1 Tax=Aurantimonas sp. A3-2-R12 TaxID=3114362 RepID=UPI002E1800AE|nr:gluconokinase [Aurantimonas sp. A3-2-R12]
MTPSSPVFLLMGVSGAGKSTVGQALAHRLNGIFLDANDFHLAKHINGMSCGIPINDFIRKGWLRRVCGAVERTRLEQQRPVFLACSALRKSNRDFLRREIDALCVIHLAGARGLIHGRMLARRDHFAPAALLDSQLLDLEAPVPLEEDAHVIDVSPSLDDVVAEVLTLVETVMQRTGRNPGAVPA